MRRRDLLATLAAPLLPAAARDPYGGWTARRLQSTGRFRLEHGRRWWLVTPDGHPYLGFGLNHAHYGLLRRKECAAQWAGRLGVPVEAPPAELLPAFHKKLRDDLTALGMNHLGVHTPTRGLPRGFAPYIHRLEFVAINHYMTPAAADFRDVFAPDFAAHCDRLARDDAAPRAADPWLIGYFFTDCPIFTEADAAPRINNTFGATRPGLPTWPRVLRNLSAPAPGKLAYVETMRERHRDIAAFNRAYATSFDSFDALAAAADWRPLHDPANAVERRDNEAFLERVVDRYYSVAAAAIRRHDPNHLVVGDKLNGNTATPDAIVRLAGRHMDLVFMQMFGYWREQRPVIERWSRLTGKPVFNGDVSFAVPYPEMPDPYGPHCRTQAERAAAFLDLAENAFSRPGFVGLTWCGWIDSLASFQKDKQHGGLQSACGDFYKPLTGAMSRFSEQMYTVAER